ncbi:ComEC/Rec2 family competence protein [Actomonas aquatica]|uniref:ComEC/Rec2 family competence protein n=1 Tax=Actomonas aquatica TaxID=2866162 RepID=A0ABZ1C958_9BACT|nr:ComEC/Rec2 family competence protein [Opitutus sp. WL0086]WRQ86850.1 ComEC/Rec2 family competence protein [Opitutus sp. WL0086]
MQLDRPMGHRAPLLWLVLPMALGIGAAHASPTALPVGGIAAVALIAIGVAVGLQRRHGSAALAAMGLALAAAGALHHENHRARLSDWNRLPPREAELVLQVERTFQGGAARGERVSLIGRVTAAPPHLVDLVGQSLFVSARCAAEAAPSTSRGSTITVRGQLEPLPRHPPAEDADGFLAYLTDRGLNFRLGRGRLIEVEPPTSAYARWREATLNALCARLVVGLEAHPDLAGALTAMVLGQRHGIGDEAKDLFMRSGTLHLFAISGLHFAVIALGVTSTLRLLRVPRLPAVLLSALLLGFYVDLIGRPPSAMRAWLMVVCVQLARATRAPGNPLAGITASALLVLLVDPLELFSAGFQMSYGIVLALLLYGLPMAERLKQHFRPWRALPESDLTRNHRRWRAGLDQTLTSVALAWAASLMGMLAGVAFFGWLSPLALLANLMLIPLAFAVIRCGFIALLCAALGLTGWVMLFNHAAALVLSVMQGVLALVMRLPGSAWPAGFWHPMWGSLAMTLVLLSMFWGYGRGWSGRWTRPWLPPVVATVMLVSGLRFA